MISFKVSLTSSMGKGISSPFPPKIRCSLSIVQYTDDTILIMGCEDQHLLWKEILHKIAFPTGLIVNYHKSCIVPINIGHDKASALANAFGCVVGSFSFTYLGLPVGLTKPQVKDYASLICRTERRLSASSRFLSYAARLQLANLVISSLPTYYMRSLKLHVGSDFRKKGQNLAAWDLVKKPKNKGGLGVIYLSLQNDALLIKQLDKFYRKENIQWINLIWQKYYIDEVPHLARE